MASPQLENGFIRIANEIWDAISSTKLSGTERRILDLILRLSYGCRKKNAILRTWSDLCVVGIKKQNIKKILENLETKKILIIDWDNKIIFFQKNYENWTSYCPPTSEKYQNLIAYNLKMDYIDEENKGSSTDDDSNPDMTTEQSSTDDQSHLQMTKQSSTDDQNAKKSNLQMTATADKPSNSVDLQRRKDNKIKTVKNNSSSSKEEEIIKNEDKKLKHILRRIDKLWSGYAIQVGTLKYSDVEEIEQYSLEAIDECFGAAEEAAIRKGNTDWLLNRLRYPDRYGVKISKPKPTEREKAVNQCKTVVNIYRNQQDENTKYMTVKTLQEWFEKFGAEFGAEIDMKLEEFEELQRSTK